MSLCMLEYNKNKEISLSFLISLVGQTIVQSIWPATVLYQANFNPIRASNLNIFKAATLLIYTPFLYFNWFKIYTQLTTHDT